MAPLLKGSHGVTPSVEDDNHDSLPPEKHPLLKSWLYNSCYFKVNDLTPSFEDEYHDSLPPDEHPLLKGSFGVDPSVEDDNHDSLPPEQHPLLKGLFNSCYFKRK